MIRGEGIDEVLTINEMRGAMAHPIFGEPVYIRARDILIAMGVCEQELLDTILDFGGIDELPSSDGLIDVLQPKRARNLPLFDAPGVDGKPCPPLAPLPDPNRPYSPLDSLGAPGSRTVHP